MLDPSQRVDPDLSDDHLSALRSLRAAKNLCLIPLALVLLLNLAAYVGVRARLLPDMPQAAAEPAEPTSAPATAEARASGWQLDMPSAGEDWLSQHIDYWWIETTVMRTARWVGVAGTVGLPFVLVLAVMVALSGRLGGVRGAVSAFFWSLVLVVLVIPWGSLVAACTYAGPLQGIEGYVDGLAELCGPPPEGFLGNEVPRRVQGEVRLVAPVVVALLLALVVQLRFRRSYRDVVQRIESAGGAPV